MAKRHPGNGPARDLPETGAERNWWRLLGTIRRLNTCETGDALNQDGVLRWAANVRMLIFFAAGEELDASEMSGDLREIAPQASQAQIDAAIAHALRSEPTGTTGAKWTMGADMDLRLNRWRACKSPMSILPRFTTPDDINEFRKAKEANRDAQRRADAGRKPQRLSDAALARKHGRDRDTIKRWREAGIIDPNTGELTGKPLPKPGRKRTRNMPQIYPVTYKDKALSLFDDVREASGQKCGVFQPNEGASPCSRPAGEQVNVPKANVQPEQPHDDRVSAPVGSANETAGKAGETFAKPERGCLPLARHTVGTDPNRTFKADLPNAGTDPNRTRATDFSSTRSLPRDASTAAGINPQEDIETVPTTQSDATDAEFGSEAGSASSAPAGPAGAVQDEGLSAAFLAALAADEQARERGDTIEGASLLWIAGKAVEAPADILDAHENVLAWWLTGRGHLTIREYRWIADSARPAWTPDATAKPAKQAQDGQAGSGPTDRPAGKSAALRAATGQRRPDQGSCRNIAQDRPTTFSAPSYRRART
jgi:hypothetical protein